MASHHRPVVLCGPSGSGKSTLLNKVLKEFPNQFGFSVSHTTRKPRPGEINGQHYHFTDVETIRQDIAEGKFIESATFGGNIYGTSKASVQAVSDEGKVCVLDIDVQGVKQVKNTDLNPWFIFIMPPSLDELKQRLIDRKTENEDSLRRRLEVAEKEMEYGQTPGNFDITIVNDNLDRAYKELKDFIANHVLKH